MRKVIISFLSVTVAIVLAFGCSDGGEENAQEPQQKLMNIAEGEYCAATEECFEGLVCSENICIKPEEPAPEPPPAPQMFNHAAVDYSCPEVGIKDLPPPEDILANLPTFSSKTKVAGLETTCSEDVNLKKRPGFEYLHDLNYFSEWFQQEPDDGKEHAVEYNYFPHLVTSWNYNLLPSDLKTTPSQVKEISLTLLDENGNEFTGKIAPCGGKWNIRFKDKIKNAYLSVSITKTVGSKIETTFGPFTVGNAWFARPEAEKPYGTSDGTGYANAFNGLRNLSKNLDKVLPGDTIFIAGVHIYNYKDTNEVGSYINLTKSGESKEQQLVYRGDYPGDKGVVWGAAKASVPWKQYSGTTYRLVLASPLLEAEGYFFEGIGKGGKLNHKVLAKANTLEKCLAQPGSYYLDGTNTGSKLYVNLSDGSNPTGKAYIGGWGYQFLYYYYDHTLGLYNKKAIADRFRYKHITFKGLVLFSQQRAIKNVQFSNVRWDDCKVAYTNGRYSMFSFWFDNDHIDIVNSEISCVGSGIYSMNTPVAWECPKLCPTINDTLKYYTFKNLYIHDIGTRNVNANDDSHPVGLQGSSFGTIEDGIFLNCGSGPVLWSDNKQDAMENIFRRNLIKLGNYSEFEYADPPARHGFDLVENPENPVPGDRRSNVVQDNIIEDCSYALNTDVGKYGDTTSSVAFEGNVIYNCWRGIVAGMETLWAKDIGPFIVAKNNAFKVLKKTGDIDVPAHLIYKGKVANYLLEFDNNTYSHGNDYTKDMLFFFGWNPYFQDKPTPGNYSITLEQWQGIQNKLNDVKCPDCLFDTHSKMATNEQLYNALLKKYDELNIPVEFRRKNP